jgi:hypothetical protein
VNAAREPGRRPRPPRSRRDAVGRVVLVLIGLALAFVLGIGFARTLDERPDPSRTETIVRTLEPLPQEAPAPTVTVTVTVTG